MSPDLAAFLADHMWACGPRLSQAICQWRDSARVPGANIYVGSSQHSEPDGLCRVSHNRG